MKNFLLVGLLLLMVTAISAQPLVEKPEQVKRELTGNIQFDSYLANPQSDPVKSLDNPNRKDPWRAALFSAVIPGAGEWYTESYKSAVAFVLAEVAFITAAIYYTNEAEDRQRAYEKIANDPETGWSVRKYADYLVYVAENSSAQPQAAKDLAAQLKVKLDAESNRFPGNRSWWSDLNNLERQMKFEHGAGYTFSHTLPSYGAQQYYELIGKYDQFNPGWWDFGNTTPGNWNAPQNLDLMRRLNETTASFRSYSVKRGKANDLHSIANSFVIFTMANHLVSAINASVQARLHNKNLEVSLGALVATPEIQTPALRFSYHF